MNVHILKHSTFILEKLLTRVITISLKIQTPLITAAQIFNLQTCLPSVSIDVILP